MKKKVSIILVTWNGKKQTLECLESLRSLKTPHDVQIIVVDNGSSDGTHEAVTSKFRSVVVLSLSSNLGFTGGNNVGIKQALGDGAEYVWLLNNDTQIDRNALSLIDAFDDNEVGIAGSKIYFAPGYEYHKEKYSMSERGKVLWYAGGIIDWKNMYCFHRGVDQVDHGQYDRTEETPFVTGCSMMVKKEVFEKIGLLDEKFFAYLEDLDFCLRAKQMGYKLLYVPQSIIWHNNAGSSAVGSQLHQFYMTRNRLLVGMQYAPVRTKFALVREAIWCLFTASSPVKRAVWDWFLGRYEKQYNSGLP